MAEEFTKKYKRRKARIKSIGKKILIPFVDGNQVHEAPKRYTFNFGKWKLNENAYEWKEPFEFQDQLEIVSYTTNRAAVYFHLVSSTTGKSYTMFLSDYMQMLRTHLIFKGVVSSRWGFRQQSEYFGIIAL